MHATRRCPHCQARLRFWRILRITNWNPYTCPTCAHASQPEPARALWIYGLCGGLGGIAAVLVTRHQAWWTLVPAILVVAMGGPAC